MKRLIAAPLSDESIGRITALSCLIEHSSVRFGLIALSFSVVIPCLHHLSPLAYISGNRASMVAARNHCSWVLPCSLSPTSPIALRLQTKRAPATDAPDGTR
jgi:hypothetical protein